MVVIDENGGAGGYPPLPRASQTPQIKGIEVVWSGFDRHIDTLSPLADNDLPRLFAMDVVSMPIEGPAAFGVGVDHGLASVAHSEDYLDPSGPNENPHRDDPNWEANTVLKRVLHADFRDIREGSKYPADCAEVTGRWLCDLMGITPLKLRELFRTEAYLPESETDLLAHRFKVEASLLFYWMRDVFTDAATGLR